MCLRRNDDHPRRPGLDKHVDQQTRQVEMPEVIRLEGCFVPVLRDRVVTVPDASVQNQQVQPVKPRLELQGEPFDGGQRAEVAAEERDVGVDGSGRLDPCRDRFCGLFGTREIPAGHDYCAVLASKRFAGGQTAARVRTYGKKPFPGFNDQKRCSYTACSDPKLQFRGFHQV